MFTNRKQISFQKQDENSPSLPSVSIGPLQTIFSFLDTNSLYQVSKTCVGFFMLSNPELKKKFLATQLLQTVMAADPEEVENMLTQLKQTHPNVCFAIIQTQGEENSRKWKKTSALEFAAWVGDTEIIDILLASVPAKYKSIALEQLENVKTNGTEHGQHMQPFQLLSEACKSYDQSVLIFNDWNARTEYCVKVIGKKQLQLPIVGLQWLCDEEPFLFQPQFKRSPTRSCLIEGKSILPLESTELGVTVYIFKIVEGGAVFNAEAICGMASMAEAFSELCKVRTEELDSRIENLKEEVAEATKKMSRKPQ